jgi:hypothetical protein
MSEPKFPVKFVLLFLFLAATASFGQDFTIVLFPDTQNEAQYYPQVLASQTKWVVANRSALNIQIVLGLGDIVNDGASTAQQQNADAAIKVLDNAKMPYLLGIGNHDYDNADTGAATRTATGFAHWWGPQRYAGYSWYKGNLNGSNENFYGELTINGKTYLFLILEYVPRSSSLGWASSIVQANPDKEIIVVTHSNMFYDNTRVDQCDTQDLNRDNDGDETWANFTSKYPNISMVVSGHITSGLAARRADLGVNGNLVNQMLSNYQVLANGGDGWMRILTFHPSRGTIDVKTFSPYLNAYKTDSKNQFSIHWHKPNVTTGSSTITGRVTTPRSASPSCAIISGATVSAGGKSTTTDNTGHYSLTVAPGTYNLSVSKSGYVTQSQSVKAWDGYGPDVNFYLAAGSGGGSSVTLSPTALSFPSQNVGSTSASQSTTLKNGTTSTLSISGINASGDFAQGNNCGSSLAAGAACSIAVTFTPTATGTRTGTLTVSDSSGSQTASLSGTGGSGGGGGGGSCTPTGANQTVTICTPANGATESSPVQVSAVAADTNQVKYMQSYLDGVKAFEETTSSSFSTSLSMSSGSHRLTVQAGDSTGFIFKTTINITVQ